jgi:uncharacterized protein YbcI
MGHGDRIATEADGRLAGGRLNAAIVNSVVGIHTRQCGRGPNRAQAFFRDNVVVVVLQNVMSQAQRTLVAGGRPDVARLVQRRLHEAMYAELARSVAGLTGCRVTCFLHDFDAASDTASELFVLDRPVPRSTDRGSGDGHEKIPLGGLSCKGHAAT